MVVKATVFASGLGSVEWEKNEDTFWDDRSVLILVWIWVTMYTFVTIKLYIRCVHFTMCEFTLVKY